MPRLIALALLTAALPLAAQDAPPAPTQQAPTTSAPAKTKPAIPTGRIIGTVLCADTHRPARGALLMINPISVTEGTAPSMAHVALDGTYTVEHVSPGTYIVIASLPGYLSSIDALIPAMMGDHSRAAIDQLVARTGSVTVTGGEAETFDITLERGASVSGRVFYSDGSPATQVSIDVEDINAKKLTGDKQREAEMAAGIFRTMFTHQNQNTDDQGHFRISGLKSGTYRVVAISSLSNNVDSQGDEGAEFALLLGGAADRAALRVYSGDTLHAKAAKTYELRAGDEVPGIDITIPLNAYHQVKGVLTAVDGRTINQATLTLTDTADDSVTFESQPSEDGAFSFATIAAGTYTLAAKDAKIITRQPGTNPDIPMRFAPTKITNAFADNTTSIIVKDSDVPDVALTLTEVPLPPQPTEPNPQPIPNDQP